MVIFPKHITVTSLKWFLWLTALPNTKQVKASWYILESSHNPFALNMLKWAEENDDLKKKRKKTQRAFSYLYTHTPICNLNSQQVAMFQYFLSGTIVLIGGGGVRGITITYGDVQKI